MKDSSTNFIELDKTKIDKGISETGEYYADGIYIKKWEPNKEENGENQDNGSDKKEADKYIATLEKNGCQYSGSLNDKFQRDGYGLELYNNGDKYFGQFDSNCRNENGIYYFAPTKSEENPQNVHTECYLGQWKNNLKDQNGMYIWMDQPENNFEFENANFDAYVGEFEDEKYLRGTYLSKLNNDYFLYHGYFDKKGEKTDDNAYFYTSKTNKIFHGKILKDILQYGILASFDDDGEKIKTIVYCTFNENGSVKDVYDESQLGPEDVEGEKRKIINFRNIILDGDYYNKIYNKFVKTKIKIDKLGDMVGVLEREQNIPEINKILKKYSKKNVYYDIEENFFRRTIENK